MPRSKLLSFSDPHAFQSSIRASDVDVVVTGRGAFHSELQQVDLNALWMQRSRTTLPVVARSAVHRARCVVFFPTAAGEAPILVNGHPVGPQSVMVYPPGTEHTMRFPAGVGWSGMSLSPADLATASQALLGRPLAPPAASHEVTVPPRVLKQMQYLHARVARLGVEDAAALDHPAVARAMEQVLVECLVACVEAAGPAAAPALSTGGAAAAIRRFHEVVRAHPTEPLHVADLCAALGISARSLARHCMEHLGMPAHRYLWLRRMQMARRALLLADPAEASVTAIAHEHGFAELGRFAVAYRGLFGEAPSATLRRPPGAGRDDLADIA